MGSYKIIFFIFAAAVFNRATGADTKAKCECGIFKSPTPDSTEEQPIASKSPQFNFECDAEGKESCANMCKALAGASKAEGPKKLCEIVENAEEAFVPLVFFRACDDKAWKYTELKPSLEVCCRNKEVVACS